LSHLNTLGYLSIGFESGQHTDPLAIKNCETFISLALNHAGDLKLNNLHNYEDKLKKASRDVSSIFEVIYKYYIQPKEDFSMEDGFESFQNIKKGTSLAKTNGKNINLYYVAMLFMPLYQKSGNDGFFIIKPILPFLLKLCELLRNSKVNSLLTLLP
jgi:hypothetical protein